MPTTYIDVFQYIRAVTGLETESLIGNKGRLSSAALVNDTTLHVTPATTVALSQFDNLTIFDGLNSETVMVGSGGASIGASTIPLLTGLQYAHAQYTTYCTDGTM